jgi:diguanylate cyclase (GGDEF)-like protein
MDTEPNPPASPTDPPEAEAGVDEADVAAAAGPTEDPVAATAGATDWPDAPKILTAPTGWSDPLTGTDGPRFWDRLIQSEGARLKRYKRSMTVVLVEITGLGSLARTWRPEVAEATLGAAARILTKELRTSDYIARIETFRFGVLLVETSEIAAINFVERARGSCERDLKAASEVLGVGFGWASPPKGGELSGALELAAKRLAAELAER